MGIQKEVGEGALEEAIKLYKEVIADKNAERKITANAQLHIGICYEKLGVGKAKEAYQNVLENFPDQHDVVAEAKKRLAKFEPELSTVNPEAREAYLKAVHYQKLGPEYFFKFLDYYKEAISYDSTFAEAYSALAKLHAFSGRLGTPKERMPIAKANAQKALELDINLGEAHTVLGLVNMYYYWDWAQAEEEFQYAIELNPNDVEAMQLYSQLLASQGRLEDALLELERALNINPVNHWVNESLADLYYYMHDYDRAIKQYQKTIDLNPRTRVTHLKLSSVYHIKNMVDKEIQSLYKYFNALGYTELAELINKTYMESGYNDAMWEWIKAWEPSGKSGGIQASSIARIYMRIGEHAKAIEWLHIGYELRGNAMIKLGIIPEYDELRSDERFLELLGKIGL
ncbi:tetratricopeptide repeat protein [Candidatus Neomarinimicrobiota bacterium]